MSSKKAPMPRKRIYELTFDEVSGDNKRNNVCIRVLKGNNYGNNCEILDLSGGNFGDNCLIFRLSGNNKGNGCSIYEIQGKCIGSFNMIGVNANNHAFPPISTGNTINPGDSVIKELSDKGLRRIISLESNANGDTSDEDEDDLRAHSSTVKHMSNNYEYTDEDSCIICLESIDGVLMCKNTMHYNFCSKCAPKLKRCPLCNASKKSLRFYKRLERDNSSSSNTKKRKREDNVNSSGSGHGNGSSSNKSQKK